MGRLTFVLCIIWLAFYLAPQSAATNAYIAPLSAPPTVQDDIFWIEDDLPAGSTALGDWQWDTTTKANGVRSHTSSVAGGINQRYFVNASQPLAFNTGDTLVCYVMTSAANPPREIMLEFIETNGSWEHRAYWGENLISGYGWGANGTVSRYFMGELPAADQWVRLEVPVSTVGLEGKSIRGMAFTLYDGQAWFDSVRKEAYSPTTYWVEDALPLGAVPTGTWNWISAPANGVRSHTDAAATGIHQHSFTSATQKLYVRPGDKLFCYVLIDQYVNKPLEIMLQWHDGASWDHRAYWGASLINWGTNGTASRYYVGGMPRGGQWVKLEVPASAVGLEGKAISGMAFTVYNGQAWFDSAGKTGKAVGDTSWVEDAEMLGATSAGTWQWDSARKANGIKSHYEPTQAGLHQHYFTGATQPLTINPGEKLVCYVLLNINTPPREIMLQWHTPQLGWGSRAYWGANLINWGTNGSASRYYAGALPQLGQWVRLEFHASSVGLEGKTITGMAFTLYDGQAWFDSAGKVAPVSNAYWVDERVPAGAMSTGTWNWDTGSKVSGTCSNTQPANWGINQHSFSGATEQLTVNPGDKLFCYVLTNVNSPPSEIMLQWQCTAEGCWEHRAYWGANVINVGINGTASRSYRGVLPQAGQWVKLEIPASEVRLEGKTIHGMAFTLYNGQAWFDSAGKTTAAALNQCPTVVTSVSSVTLGAGGPVKKYTLNGEVFADLDGGPQPMTFTVTGNTNPSVASAAVISNFGFPDLEITPLAPGTTQVTVTADDGGGCDPLTQWQLTVTVVPNRAPVVKNPVGTLCVIPDNPSTPSVAEGQVKIDARYDADPVKGIFDELDDEGMTFQASSANPSIADIRMVPAPFTSGPNIILQITGLALGTTTGTITATDTTNHTTTHTFTVSVDNPPKITTEDHDNNPSTPEVPIFREVRLASSGTTHFERRLNAAPAVFTDPDPGDVLTYSVVQFPNVSIATLRLGSAVSPPDPSQADLLQVDLVGEGVTTATIKATDSRGCSTNLTFTIKAATGNPPVVIRPLGTQTFASGQVRRFILWNTNRQYPSEDRFSDPDPSDVLTFAVTEPQPNSSAVQSVTIHKPDSRWAVDVRAANVTVNRTTTISITAYDTHGNEVTDTMVVNVTVGGAPRIKAGFDFDPNPNVFNRDYVVAYVGQPNPSWLPSEVFEDPDGDPMTFSVGADNNPSIAEVTFGRVTVSPHVDLFEVLPKSTGCTMGTIVATDSKGNRTELKFAIYVNRTTPCTETGQLYLQTERGGASGLLVLNDVQPFWPSARYILTKLLGDGQPIFMPREEDWRVSR